MDMSDTYRRIARRYFPNATIVADRFHVVRLINHHLLKVWKAHDAEGRKYRGLISLMHRHQMSRRAYGFRHSENYRLRVLAHCGWDGIINRVQ